MRIKLSIGLCVLALAAAASGCSKSDNTNATANANSAGPNTASANTSPVNPTTGQNSTGTDPTQNVAVKPNPPSAAPDNSEIQTVMDPNDGSVTETRTFKNNKYVTKVVRTTRDGTNRTVRVYNAKGESRALAKDKVENAMKDSGDAIAAAAGWTVDKSKDAASATKEGAEVVVDKTTEGAKTVADKTVQGAKKVGSKTAEGAKKGAKAVKNAVTP